MAAPSDLPTCAGVLSFLICIQVLICILMPHRVLPSDSNSQELVALIEFTLLELDLQRHLSSQGAIFCSVNEEGRYEHRPECPT